jgi:hypothetical protein
LSNVHYLHQPVSALPLTAGGLRITTLTQPTLPGPDHLPSSRAQLFATIAQQLCRFQKSGQWYTIHRSRKCKRKRLPSKQRAAPMKMSARCREWVRPRSFVYDQYFPLGANCFLIRHSGTSSSSASSASSRSCNRRGKIPYWPATLAYSMAAPRVSFTP